MAAPDTLRYAKIPLTHGSGAIPALGFGTQIPDLLATAAVYSTLVPARSTTNPQTSIVECRKQLKLVGLAFVMIDEERRLVRCDQLPDSFH